MFMISNKIQSIIGGWNIRFMCILDKHPVLFEYALNKVSLKWRGSNLGKRNKIKSRVEKDNTGKMQRDWDHIYNGVDESESEEEE